MQIDNYFKAKGSYAEFLQVITVKQRINNKCYNYIYMLNKGVVVMEYKLLVEEDLSKCTETFIEVFNDAPWNDKWTFSQAKKYLLDFYQTPGFLGVLAIENDEILGCILGVNRVWWSGDEFFINEMYVKQQQQNKGIGRALLNHLIKELDNNKINNIVLLTDRGIPAEEFYKKNGFEEIERIIFLHKNIKQSLSR